MVDGAFDPELASQLDAKMACIPASCRLLGLSNDSVTTFETYCSNRPVKKELKILYSDFEISGISEYTDIILED